MKGHTTTTRVPLKLAVKTTNGTIALFLLLGADIAFIRRLRSTFNKNQIKARCRSIVLLTLSWQLTVAADFSGVFHYHA